MSKPVENVTQAALSTPSVTMTTLWAKWCREVAAANGMTYEEVCAKLDAGEACLEISTTFRPLQGRPISDSR